jgi:hypothetical protein
VAEDAREVEHAIARDREALAETVEALAHKADVKARARDAASAKVEELQQKTSEVRDRIRDATPEAAKAKASTAVQAAQSRPVPFAVGALLVGFVVGRSFGRRS